MAAPDEPTRQYEVWKGSFHNDPVLFRKVLHVMTPAETMQPQYTFSGDLDEFGQPSHEPAHVAWPPVPTTGLWNVEKFLIRPMVSGVLSLK